MNPDARPLVLAHRGASGYRPEHTRSAYLLAIEMGADGIELDVVPTKDGVLVVRHEGELSSTTDVAEHPEFANRYATKIVCGREMAGFFTEDFTWSELSTLRCRERMSVVRPANSLYDGTEPILRFCDVLALYDELDLAETLLILEVKHASYFDEKGLFFEEMIERELHSAGWAANDPRLVLESFEKTILGRLRERGVGSRHVYLLEFGKAAWDEVLWAAEQGVPSLSYADELSVAGVEILAENFDAISVDSRFLVDALTGSVESGSSFVEAAQQSGLDVFTWTLRPENKFLPAKWHVGEDQAAWGNWSDYFAAIYSLGVDAIFADHPDLAIATKESVSGRP